MICRIKLDLLLKSVAILSGALFIFCPGLHAQIGNPLTLSDKTIETDLRLDLNDSVRKKPAEFRMKKEPWRAVLYSALLPGAGQFYNESYWKIPVVAGLGGYFAYGIINNNNQYNDYKSQYEMSQTESNPDGNPQLKTFRDFYKDQRDDFIVYAVILYVINLVDAYVDAQLFDFDVSDLRNGSSVRMKLNYSF